MALSGLSFASIAGQELQREGKKLTRLVTISITGDNSSVSGSVASIGGTANWWKVFDIPNLEYVEVIHPITLATPTAANMHTVKFNSTFDTIYIGGGTVMTAAAYSGVIKLIGY